MNLLKWFQKKQESRILKEWLEAYPIERKTETELKMNPITNRLIEQLKIEHLSEVRNN